MESYTGMIENLDHNIGRVIEHLESIEEADNCFALFMFNKGAEGSV